MKLYLVIGGPLGYKGDHPVNEKTAEIIGLYSNYDEAVEAWRSAAMRTIDEAETRVLILPLHKMISSILKPQVAK